VPRRRLPPVLLPLLLAASAVSAQGTPPCEETPAAVLFLENETSLENLAFDGNGSLYLSDAGGARILRVGPEGQSKGQIDLDAHGIVWGPDGRLYAAVTAGPDTYDIQRSTDATATAFEVYSAGLPVYNGMAFDGAGDLYVSDDSVTPPVQPPDLVRVPRSAPMDWIPWTPLYGPNGLAYDAATDSMFTVITADQSSPVLRLSTTDAGAVDVVAHLSFGAATLEPGVHAPAGDPTQPVPKGLDDLALGPDGRLYVVGHLSGELLRVDPADGSACLLASGLEEPTSARFANGFGPHDGRLFVTTWGGTGVTGIAAGSADQHPPGKVWVFDLGLLHGPTAVPQPPMDGTTADAPGSNGTADDGSGKESPATGLALAWVVLATAVLLRRR
jgi:sugar lactone lactonase YvrE